MKRNKKKKGGRKIEKKEGSRRRTGKGKKNCVFSKLLFVLSLTSLAINHFEEMDIYFLFVQSLMRTVLPIQMLPREKETREA